jgi:hypothetical protein
MREDKRKGEDDVKAIANQDDVKIPERFQPYMKGEAALTPEILAQLRAAERLTVGKAPKKVMTAKETRRQQRRAAQGKFAKKPKGPATASGRSWAVVRRSQRGK